MHVTSKLCGYIDVVVVLLTIVSTCAAKYGGGSGTAADAYQIATAADLIAMGNEPNDYGKHFILTADIDLDPNLPGRKVFDKAVIAPDIAPTSWGSLEGIPFAGVFDGNGHSISNLAVEGGSYLGLFGWLGSGSEVRDLGVVDVHIAGSGDYVGGLVAENFGYVTGCHSTGVVSGGHGVGGLVGDNVGAVTHCRSVSAVCGSGFAGGLVGINGYAGYVTHSCSNGAVCGVDEKVGGLVGSSWGAVSYCYSVSPVCGGRFVGGLVGVNGYAGCVTRCYSTGTVDAGGSYVGGLVGSNVGDVTHCCSTGLVNGTGWSTGGLVGYNSGNVTGCFWDIQTSGQAASGGGTGKTTAQMQGIQTYIDEGWDFVGDTENGTSQTWQMPEGGGYPVLAILSGYPPPQLQGLGTPEEPYLISDAMELGAVVHYSPYAHYRLTRSIDLLGIHWAPAAIPWFAGAFDGNGLTVSHLTITGGAQLGLFGWLTSEAEVKDVSVADVRVTGSADSVGGLAGTNDGCVTRCYSTGIVNGKGSVGGLVGSGGGTVTRCHSTTEVSGNEFVGGLIGENYGYVTTCYSDGTVRGHDYVGGLVGSNLGDVTHCYSRALVSGDGDVGGLSGYNVYPRWDGLDGTVTACFWDMQTSGQAVSGGGTGLSTAQMQTAGTYLAVGWDFVGETANGTADIWWIVEGKDYPRLWWEVAEE